MEIDYHFIQEKMVNRDLMVRFVTSADQVADIFTKGLSTVSFNKLKSKLNVDPLPLSLRARIT